MILKTGCYTLKAFPRPPGWEPPGRAAHLHFYKALQTNSKAHYPSAPTPKREKIHSGQRHRAQIGQNEVPLKDGIHSPFPGSFLSTSPTITSHCSLSLEMLFSKFQLQFVIQDQFAHFSSAVLFCPVGCEPGSMPQNATVIREAPPCQTRGQASFENADL